MKKLIYFIALIFVFQSCSEDSIDPESSFTKIYDSQNSDVSYHPIDIVETTSGYIVLAGQDTDNSQFRELQVIQLDLEGNYLVEAGVPGSHVAPMGEFISIDSMYYFFTMEPILNTAQLVRMGNDPSTADVINIGGGIEFPLAANRTANGNLMLLSYDVGNTETVLSIMDTDGQIVNSAGFNIGAGNDVEPFIWQHYNDPERAGQPFACGENGIDSYYFNGFFNFNLSLVFTDLSGVSGTIQGQDVDNGGVRAIMPLGSDAFTLFGYQYNTNFIQSNLTIDTQANTSITDYFNMDFTEFRSRTPSIIRSMTLNGTTYSIVAAESQSRKVTLYFYDVATGELAGIHNIGHINPYTLGSIRVDAEDNLLVLGTTLVSNRFERIFLNKISTEELNAILQ